MAKVKKAVSKKPTKKVVKVTVVKSKRKAVKVKAAKAKKPVKAKAKVAKKPAKKTVVKKLNKNPKGSYSLHMQKDLPWLHKQAKIRGMQTSVFVRECIQEYVNNHPIADEQKVA